MFDLKTDANSKEIVTSYHYKSEIDQILQRDHAPSLAKLQLSGQVLANVIGKAEVHELDGSGFEALGDDICSEIGKIVDVRLPDKGSAYANLISWVIGTSRDYSVEVFTTNYDLLLEEAFESVQAPYFDGFTGGREPFFDPVSVASNDLPARWTRLWKLHGSLGWCSGENGEIIRTGKSSVSHLVFPEHLKYEQTQKAPYTALLDRLKAFLYADDCLLVSIGFSYADAHIAAIIDEGLAGNASASVFAFMHKTLDEESAACDLARKRPNFSVYARDMAMMNGVPGEWVVPSELPSKDWGPIRSTYWGRPSEADSDQFLLGSVEPFCQFLAASRSTQVFSENGLQSPESAPVATDPA